jgi:DNA-binding NtrC family response regulator
MPKSARALQTCWLQEMKNMQRDIALIVDDHADTCEMLGHLLRTLNYKVETCDTFDSALRRIKFDHLCVAFVDYAVPGTMNAAQFIIEVRKVNPDLRIVLVSGVHKVAKLAHEIGADGWLAKPFQLEDIIREVESNCPKHA